MTKQINSLIRRIEGLAKKGSGAKVEIVASGAVAILALEEKSSEMIKAVQQDIKDAAARGFDLDGKNAGAEYATLAKKIALAADAGLVVCIAESELEDDAVAYMLADFDVKCEGNPPTMRLLQEIFGARKPKETAATDYAKRLASAIEKAASELGLDAAMEICDKASQELLQRSIKARAAKEAAEIKIALQNEAREQALEVRRAAMVA